MENLCALSSISTCKPEYDDGKAIYYAVEQLDAVKVNEIFSQLSNDSYYDNLTEKWLIESRSGVSLPLGSKIFAKHRHAYGTKWRAHKRCYHPDHSDHQQAKKKKISGLRDTLMDQFKLIHQNYPSFPLFAPVCTKHRTSLAYTDRSEGNVELRNTVFVICLLNQFILTDASDLSIIEGKLDDCID